MNAIIMAAGMSSRFAPLSYERPKGLLVVKGEVLIERQIRQLQDAGITDITIVVGYMKEMFFYLENKMNVKIVVNEDYFRYNNTSSLMCVLDRISDTYICSSDNYFSENVFKEEPNGAYYSAQYVCGPTDEWCLYTDDEGIIDGIIVGGADCWIMSGHVYFDRRFSEKFISLLKMDYEKEECRNNLWEHFYMQHLDVLRMKIRCYGPGIIYEFDSLDELRGFDESYICNTDSRIIRNICDVLDCSEKQIMSIQVIKQGLTNTSFSFSVVREDDKVDRYVYRHPGIGTEEYINRDSEMFSMDIAAKLGLDDTFIYMSPKGWKISRYVENARTLDYHNEKDVANSLKMIRKLHDANIISEYDFHIWERACDFVERIREKGRSDFADFQELYDKMDFLFRLTKRDGVVDRLCHCDCYDPNFLIGDDDKMYLIDWEYSGNDDPASDLGTYICCSDYSEEEADDIIRRYLCHEPKVEELRHYYAYIAIAAYYWYVWAIYQTSIGKNVGEYLYLWYKMSIKYCDVAMSMYLNNNVSIKQK